MSSNITSPHFSSNDYNLSSHINNLIQYFYIAGWDKQTTTITSFYTNDRVHDLNPVVLSRYPNTDLPYLSIPNEIIASHCFPTGLKLLGQIKDKNKDPFTFTLDNPNPISNNNNHRHEKIYFTCYPIYESINNYYRIYSLQNPNFETTLPTFKFVPKVLCICSFVPFHIQYIKILKALNEYTTTTVKAIEFPIENIIDHLVFNIPTPPRGLFRVNYELFHDIGNIRFERTGPNDIPNPDLELEVLVKYFKVENIFQILKCLILEIPVMVFCENKYDLTTTVEAMVSLIYPFICFYPIIAIMPKENYSIIQSMKSYIIGINSKYSDTYFSENNIEISNVNIVIVKMCSDSERKKSEIIHRKPEADKPKLILINLRPVDHEQQEDVYNDISMPLHYQYKITKQLTEYWFKQKSAADNRDKFRAEFRKMIFNFFVSIWWDYQHYWVRGCDDKNEVNYRKFLQKEATIEDWFDIPKYWESQPKQWIPFYLRFFKTQLFFKFITKKLFPQSLQDRLDIWYFDENITLKSNRKVFIKKHETPFLNLTDFEKRIDINIKMMPMKFNGAEKEYLWTDSGQRKALEYHQFITYENEVPLESNGAKHVYHKYYGFPWWWYDGVYFKAINMYNHSNNLFVTSKQWSVAVSQESPSCEIDGNVYYRNHPNKLLDDYDNKCYEIMKEFKNYGMNSILMDPSNNVLYPSIKPNMLNYILLLWWKYFSLTFWYIRPSERKVHCQEMMNILSMCSCVDSNTHLRLFNSMLQYGDWEKTQEIFIQINPKTYIMILLLRLKIKTNNKPNYDPNTSLITLSPTQTSINKLDKLHEIYFETKRKCNHCNYYFDLIKESTTFESMNYSVENFNMICKICYKKNPMKMNGIVLTKDTEGCEVEIPFSFNMLPPFYWYEIDWIKSNNKINISSFSKQYPDRFWNAMWYFSCQKIPIDFLIPYKQTTNYLTQSTGTLMLKALASEKIPDLSNEINYDLASEKSFFEYKTQAQSFDDSHFIFNPLKKRSVDISMIIKSTKKFVKVSDSEMKFLNNSSFTERTNGNVKTKKQKKNKSDIWDLNWRGSYNKKQKLRKSADYNNQNNFKSFQSVTPVHCQTCNQANIEDNWFVDSNNKNVNCLGKKE